MKIIELLSLGVVLTLAYFISEKHRAFAIWVAYTVGFLVALVKP